jgi:hypothetical protein
MVDYNGDVYSKYVCCVCGLETVGIVTLLCNFLPESLVVSDEAFDVTKVRVDRPSQASAQRELSFIFYSVNG